MISASSKGLTLVVCPVVKFVMVSSSTTKQPEKQRFFSFDTFDTPQKKHTKKTQEFLLIPFLLIKKKLETFLLQKKRANIDGSISTNFRGL